MTCQANTAPFDWAGRPTRDGSDGGTLPYFSLQGVPAAPCSVSLRMPSWQGMTILMLSLHFNAEFDQGVEGSAVERGAGTRS